MSRSQIHAPAPPPNISQRHIRSQLQTYLSFKSKTNPEQYKQSDVKAILKRLRPGHCYGFSVTQAAFNHCKKRRWWQSLLEQISQWNSNQNTVHLQASLIQPTRLTDETETKSLEQLFELAISYLCFNQQHTIAPYALEQNALLDAHKNLFCVLVNSIPNHVKGRYTFYEAFTKSRFQQLMRQLQNKSDMTFLHVHNHTCSIRFKHGRIFFYDPNHKQGERCFASYSKLYDHISRRFSENFAIDAVVLSDQRNTKLHKTHLHYQAPLSLNMLDNHGIHLCNQYLSTAQLTALFKLANTRELQTRTVNSLNQISDGWSGWATVARHSPDNLSTLLSFATTSEQQNAIVNALNTINTDGWSGWALLARNAPIHLETIMPFIHGPIKQATVINALNSVNTGGWSGWATVARYSPDNLSTLLSFATTSEQQNAIVNTLNTVKNNGWSGWSTVAQRSPGNLHTLLPFINTQEQRAAAFAALNQHNSNKFTGWDYCIDNLKQRAFKQLIRQIVSSAQQAAEVIKHVKKYNRDKMPQFAAKIAFLEATLASHQPPPKKHSSLFPHKRNKRSAPRSSDTSTDAPLHKKPLLSS